MGRFACVECEDQTSVIETRLINSRIRRRRLCSSGHRFNTLEVPVDAQDRLHALLKWVDGHLDKDLTEYLHSQVDTIMLGTPEEGEEDELPPS